MEFWHWREGKRRQTWAQEEEVDGMLGSEHRAQENASSKSSSTASVGLMIPLRQAKYK